MTENIDDAWKLTYLLEKVVKKFPEEFKNCIKKYRDNISPGTYRKGEYDYLVTNPYDFLNTLYRLRDNGDVRIGFLEDLNG
jgi:hypothetical protein